MPASGPHPALASDPARRRSLVGLTPLIDVVFILLVFFMLASSFADWRTIRLKPPVPTAGGGGLAGAMLIEVDADGGLRLSGVPTTLEEIGARIEPLLGRRPDLRVVVKPAADTPLQPVVSLLDRLNAAGVTDMTFIHGGD
ncbi:MAG: biopolymer transporter ExbD [Alphaproteobacteria bacterium]